GENGGEFVSRRGGHALGLAAGRRLPLRGLGTGGKGVNTEPAAGPPPKSWDPAAGPSPTLVYYSARTLTRLPRRSQAPPPSASPTGVSPLPRPPFRPGR